MGLNNGDHLHPFGEPFGWTEEEIQKHGLRELLKAVDNKNDELIYKQDALDALRICYNTEAVTYTNGNEYISYDQALEEIERLPSAQSEIIRCKDCKDKRIYKFPPTYDVKHYCERHEKVTELDNYCSWAERKDNG